jgi:hypothetical protein
MSNEYVDKIFKGRSMKENQNNGTCLSMKTCLVRLEMDLSLVVE